MGLLQVARIVRGKCVIFVNSGSLSVYSENHGNVTENKSDTDMPSISTSISTSLCASSATTRLQSKRLLGNATLSSLGVEKDFATVDAALEAGRFSDVIHYRDMWSPSGSTTAAQILDFNKIAISFEDGRVRILLLQLNVNDFLAGAPSVLFDFQNHPDSSSAVQHLSVCPWVTRTVQSTSFELMTYSTDHFISHWHFKLRNVSIPSLDKDDSITRHSAIQVCDPLPVMGLVPVPESILCRGVRQNEFTVHNTLPYLALILITSPCIDVNFLF